MGSEKLIHPPLALFPDGCSYGFFVRFSLDIGLGTVAVTIEPRVRLGRPDFERSPLPAAAATAGPFWSGVSIGPHFEPGASHSGMIPVGGEPGSRSSSSMSARYLSVRTADPSARIWSLVQAITWRSSSARRPSAISARSSHDFWVM